MRALFILLFVSLSTSAFAGTTACQGSHALIVNWDAAQLTIDGKTYQMKKDKNGKKSFTLRGNDITFSHTEDNGQYHSVLHMNGGSESYRCRKLDGPAATQAAIVPYKANFVANTGPADITAGPESHSTTGGGKGGKGGKGGGGGRNK